MAFLPEDPWKRMELLRKSFDHFLTDFPLLTDDELFVEERRLDVQETNYHVIVTCEIPDFYRKEDIHVEVEREMLHLYGRSQRMNETSDDDSKRTEIYEEYFQRFVVLPSPVDEAGKRVIYNEGILEVTLPKRSSIISYDTED
ncbi:Hsp20/alpha crystallin family protein [Bacillaceae bacterium SIJ1]|uniref:Hsp20/alpha crystallin family protein n=1 Tax=Litoribacterium kuwaitense TaxID=1398745 RepID=UPI0013EDF722|nr:Hsp20/alpha crystallin family protein [Litoribacterium kuwaitense]NGP46393.1 Hsp20/alpha crystallin family protein [Litoribacterium kuwaitense]